MYFVVFIVVGVVFVVVLCYDFSEALPTQGPGRAWAGEYNCLAFACACVSLDKKKK